MGQRSGVSEAYLQGFRSALTEGSVELPEEYVFWPEHPLITPEDSARKIEFFKETLGRLQARSDRPTAVFATFDRIGELLYLAAIQLGLTVPRDLSIVCFGDKHRFGAILPRLTTVAIDEIETGRKACELLTAMQMGSRSVVSDEVVKMPVSLDVAETLGPPKQT
jgi:LacI family transcriptional regulator